MWYWAVRGILGFLSRILFSIKIEGPENMPASGAVVLCSNHVSWWDPVLIANAVRRPICFMAKSELFRIPLLGWLMRRVNAFPVDRGKPDLSAIRDSMAVLHRGEVLGIFPEGTRQKGRGVLGVMHPGAALIALRTDSPVMPAAIRGRFAFRGTVTVSFGQPITLKGTTGRASRDMEQAGKTITEAITSIWEALGEVRG